jgi:flagellin
MSSINTNVASMQALQSLQQTNQSLESTQNRISTGFKVGNAKDNAAIWSVAQVMRSDISGFESISEQLSLGESTVAVARNASETVSDLTDQIKERVVAAQGDNVDREKIQADINELRQQIESVVDAAQFNGSNLLKDGSGTTFDVLSSLDRDSSQNVSASDISVRHQNLQLGLETAGQVGLTSESGEGSATYQAVLDNGGTYTAGDLSAITVTSTDGNGVTTTESLNVKGMDAGEIQTALGTLSGTFGSATFDGQTLDLAGGDTVNAVSFVGDQVGLSSIGEIDVTTAEGAEHALSAMEGFMQHSIDAAANFGSAQMRIETQMNFVSKLTDSLTAGVGSLVDADMTAESAKLNALQVQQQLGTQALSIANQAPQALLSLFR